MLPAFFGRFEHSLDLKGRIVLPARFRAHFDSQAYLSQFLDGCLALWTPEEFSRRLERHAEAQERSAAERNLARVFAAGSTEVEIDKQGRFAVPQYLKEYAGLDRAVVVVGAIQRVELWSPDVWQRRIAPSEDELSNPPDARVPAGGD